jgi:pimeloyl-ACP methyl ester carboxylesterase
MNVVCLGDGLPTVLFEQGGDGAILNWRKVQRAITRLTRTCFYDRAGFGYSDPSPRPLTAFNVTDDTQAVIRAARIRTPVVIVGHSIGGFYATVYADRFPNEVAGLVLIEPGFADQSGFLTVANREIGLRELRNAEEHLPVCADKAKHGQLHLGVADDCVPFPKPNAPDEAAYLARMAEGPLWYLSEYDQSRRYFMADKGKSEDTLQEEAVRRTFGDMPLTVLSAEGLAYDDWMDASVRQTFASYWRKGHAELAARSSAGTNYIVQGSQHFIQRTNPDAVIAAVTKVVEQARENGNLH